MTRPREVALNVDFVTAEKAFDSRLAESIASGTDAASFTTFMPRPPPPNAALIAIGQPLVSPNSTISAALWTNSVVPGTMGAPPRRAALREETLSPISTIAAGGGLDEGHTHVGDGLGKVGILRENP